MPTYDSFIYRKSKADIEITPEIFQELLDNIYVETVFNYTINDVTYVSYSQAVPPDTKDQSEIQYWLFFFLPKDESYAAEAKIGVDEDFQSVFQMIVLIVCGGLLLAVAIIMFFVYRTAKKITQAIDVMTDFTNRLKKATDVASKREIIREMS